ncbi:MAG: hypothetical protein OEW83_08050 [Acidimicrobiia bacterium]|nr:hypothetical protein [Acidimicrobiia bacterium]
MADTDPTTQFLHSSMPLAETPGIRARRADADRVVLEMAWSPQLCSSGGRIGKVIQTQTVLWPRA